MSGHYCLEKEKSGQYLFWIVVEDKSARLPPIVVTVADGSSKVAIRISDQGGGIPHEDMAKVTPPYPFQCFVVSDIRFSAFPFFWGFIDLGLFVLYLSQALV